MRREILSRHESRRQPVALQLFSETQLFSKTQPLADQGRLGTPRVQRSTPGRGSTVSKTARTQHWCGRSGRCYPANVVNLIFCAAPHRVAYVLVSRDAAGRALGLFAGLALSRTPTLNLARIRHRAAKIGANEIHTIDLTHCTGTYAARQLVRDIRSGLARHGA